LKDYLNLLYQSEEEVFKLIITFWWILKDEGKLYLYKEIDTIPTEYSEYLSVEYDRNQFSHNTDHKIKLFSNYFIIYEGLTDMIDLSIRYVHKKPSILPELVHTFRSYLLGRYEDYDSCFYRQNILLDILTGETKDYAKAKRLIFYEIAKDLLSVEFQDTTGNSNKSISINTITIPPGKSIFALRSKVWNYIDENFKRHRDLCMTFISFSKYIDFLLI
jgi:hypothetical protein